jgi:hypothetical protein
MALFDTPPHSVTIYGPPTTSRDAGGGESVTWPTTRQSAVPCLINTATSSTQNLFAQQGIVVTHTISILSGVLASAVARGDKVVADDNSAVYHIEGIRSGRNVRTYGRTPEFTYLEVREQL